MFPVMTSVSFSGHRGPCGYSKKNSITKGGNDEQGGGQINTNAWDRWPYFTGSPRACHLHHIRPGTNAQDFGCLETRSEPLREFVWPP